MQTAGGRNRQRFGHDQVRRLALITGLVGSLAVVAGMLALTGGAGDEARTEPVLLEPGLRFAETLDKGSTGVTSLATSPQTRFGDTLDKGSSAGSGSDGAPRVRFAETLDKGFSSGGSPAEAPRSRFAEVLNKGS